MRHPATSREANARIGGEERGRIFVVKSRKLRITE
jgi:hypothetical protein